MIAGNGTPVLRLSGLVLAAGRTPIDAEIRAGEILGLAGLEGHGQETLLQVMAGLEKPIAGRVAALGPNGEATIGGLHEAARAGVAYLPRDRRATGIFPALSVLDNFGLPSMSRFSRAGILARRAQRAKLAEYTEFLAIKYADMAAPITSLSGGNQQKVLLARWLAMEPRVMLLNDPTRGVDLGTRMKFYEVFRDLAAKKGIALVVLSTEIEEVLQICDRVLVFRDHAVHSEMGRAEMTTDAVLAAMFGRSAA